MKQKEKKKEQEAIKNQIQYIQNGAEWILSDLKKLKRKLRKIKCI